MAEFLDDTTIRDAQPREKKYWISDQLNGLHLQVMPSGSKYWKFRYRFAGRNDELTAVKPYPDGTLKAARKEARRLQVIVDSGKNPRLEKKATKAANIRSAFNKFREAANEWHAFRSRAWAKPTSRQAREYLDKDIIPALGRFALDEITPDQLAVLLEDINKRAPDVATKARQWIGKIFEYARARQWTNADPTRDLKAITFLGKPSEPHAHLPIEELPALLIQLKNAEAHPSVKGAAWLAILTGNRPGVTRTVRWAEIDFEKRIWTIRRQRELMKGGYAHTTPLSQQTVELLREQQRISGTFEYVFIGRNDPNKPISDTAVKGLLDRMGYRGKQTMHGFRHVLSTALNEMGYPADHIERQLAHTDPDKIRGTYNSAPYLAGREEMLQDWADWLDQAMMREQSSK